MDYPVKIAVTDRRNKSIYKNTETTWGAVKDRCCVPIRTTETVEEYPKLTKKEREDLKDVGGFVGGFLREGRRTCSNVISRCVGMLDADNIPSDVGRCDQMNTRRCYGWSPSN